MKQFFLLFILFCNYSFVTAQNRIGIGTTSPTEKLHIVGNVRTDTLKTTALRVSGSTPGTGKVLTSDASGNASWKTPSSSGGGTITMTDTLIIPFSAFFPNKSSIPYSDASDGTSRSPLLPQGTIETVKFQAPVLLPVGSFINSIAYCYSDNNDLALTFTLYKDGRWKGVASSTALHPGIQSTNNGGIIKTIANYNFPNPAVIENLPHWIEVACVGWTNNSMTIGGARIVYTKTYTTNQE